MKDYIVPLGIIAVIGSILLPLPSGVIDFLLIANLVLALILMMSALSVTNPLKLSSLPSMLLLATLYRLALNISTTRLILGEGNAGHVIEAFGSVVIRGNLIVGAVVFLVITLVQFIVIAKGSERVAEVSARFTLDALPGKQMSIDADVRAGLIDFETARKKRNELQTESRFYGALDGAMKFVKGDAIAGMVITAINILGGFAVGIFLGGMELGTAVSKYTTLTVGDGLMSQIPALLNSLAAGMVITRVVREEDRSLARELINQIGQLQSVKFFIGGVALLLAFAPGMPAIPCILISGFLLLTAIMGSGDEAAEDSSTVTFTPKIPPVLSVEMDQTFARRLSGAAEAQQYIEGFRQSIFDRTGLVLALPDFQVKELQEIPWRISFRGLMVSTGEDQEDHQKVMQNLVSSLEQVIKDRSVECIDDVLTRRTLDFFDAQAPELVSAVVPGIVTLTQLTGVLKGLVEEGVSIRNFDLILQAIAEEGPKVQNDRELLQEVRVSLGSIITHPLMQNSTLAVVELDPRIDLRFVRAEQEEDPLDTEALEKITTVFQEEKNKQIPLLCSKRARRLIRECLDMQELPVTVIAHEEIPKGTPLKIEEQIEDFEEQIHKEIQGEANYVV